MTKTHVVNLTISEQADSELTAYLHKRRVTPDMLVRKLVLSELRRVGRDVPYAEMREADNDSVVG
jgi:hypothetical protein